MFKLNLQQVFGLWLLIFLPFISWKCHRADIFLLTCVVRKLGSMTMAS